MDNKYVYPYTCDFAKSNSKSDEENCHSSYKQNVACKKAIEAAIKENFDGLRLKPETAKNMIAEFGYDRVNWVLANTIQRKKDEGRFSQDNKQWAKRFDIPVEKVRGIDRRREFVVDSHPAVLDGFIDQARKEYQSLNLWNRTHCNDRTNLDYEGKVMILDPTNLKDAYKSSANQLIYCERVLPPVVVRFMADLLWMVKVFNMNAMILLAN